MPETFAPSINTSFGHLSVRRAGADHGVDGFGDGDAGGEAQQRDLLRRRASWRRDSVASRLPSCEAQARPRRPRPAVWRRAISQTGPRLRRVRRGGAPPGWWSRFRRTSSTGACAVDHRARFLKSSSAPRLRPMLCSAPSANTRTGKVSAAAAVAVTMIVPLAGCNCAAGAAEPDRGEQAQIVGRRHDGGDARRATASQTRPRIDRGA